MALFRCLNSPQLIIAEVQSILIPQQIKGHLLQRPIAGVDVLYQQIQKVFRAHPSPQSLRHIGGFAKIQKPDTGLCFILLQVRSAIGGKGKRHFIAAPASHLVLGILNTNITGIVFPLIVDHGGNVLVFRFCLNDTDKLQTNKKGIIGAAMISHGGISGPLSYGKIPTFGWASAVGESADSQYQPPSPLDGVAGQ